ncbi:cytochrome P450 [Pleurotus eryngii]|uniref:Cytochrome P450 n=1 Tax=Pleurotus eryngii TaxID=5323 RepID=A0A9P6DKZ2_PLEER|nr:cytochrome P450 [Pleurotus eryngii]
MISALLAGIAISFVIYRLVHDGAPKSIPRVGNPGGIGYLITALRYTIKSEEVLDEADRVFDGRPYALPTLGGWVIVLSAGHAETLRASNDSIFNQPIRVNESLQLDHTMNNKQQKIPFQATVIRNELTKGIANLIPEILDESTLAMEETFRSPSGSEYVSLPVFHTMTHMIGRISNRAVMGTEICRNEHFVHAIVSFAETLTVYSQLLNWTPNVPGLRSLVYFVLSSIWGSAKQPMAFVKPYVAKRLEERKVSNDHPFNIAEFLLENAPLEMASDADELAMRILNVNFGSIHTTSIFLSQTLFEMAQMSAEDIESVRKEVKEVLDQERGWNKSALNKFWKIDSILREVARMHGLSFLGMNRITIAKGNLPDGVVIPSGYQVAVNLKHFHRDPQVYPNPHVFDPFRFSKLRENEDSSVKYGFTTVDPHFLPFGAGRHACPGRFFAAMELKIMIAIILLNYDFKLPDGEVTRPKDVIFAGAVIPPTKEHLLFKPRA